MDLAVQCGRPLMMRQPFNGDAFDQVILGCVNVISEEMNPARIAALRLGLGEEMPAYTMQINCGTGMLSIDTAFQSIRTGRSDLILAGGSESLSHSPLLFRQSAVNWFAKLGKAKSPVDKIKTLLKFSPKYFAPVIGLKRGLTDPIVEMNMGQTAEKLAYLFQIDRKDADRFAVTSHMRLHNAQKEGHLDGEVVPAFDRQGNVYEEDDGVRPDSAVDKLGKLKPVFEPPFGSVTAGNSSQVTDGASWVILASEEAVKKYKLEPIAEIRDSHWAALDPSIMGLGPVMASTPLMQRNDLDLDRLDLVEINEAFAAQVLACLKAWESDEFCKQHLGLEGNFGRLDQSRLNIDGGAIALGHPVGTSGNRIVLHAANALKRRGGQYALASQCIGGGQGGAMLLRAV